MCGGGNFTQPRTNKGRACGGSSDSCVKFTEKTKFACGYKCGWKGPKYWNFAKMGFNGVTM